MAPCWVWSLFGAMCGSTVVILAVQTALEKAHRYDVLCQEQVRLQREAKPSMFSIPSEFGPMVEAIQRSLKTGG